MTECRGNRDSGQRNAHRLEELIPRINAVAVQVTLRAHNCDVRDNSDNESQTSTDLLSDQTLPFFRHFLWYDSSKTTYLPAYMWSCTQLSAPCNHVVIIYSACNPPKPNALLCEVLYFGKDILSTLCLRVMFLSRVPVGRRGRQLLVHVSLSRVL